MKELRQVRGNVPGRGRSRFYSRRRSGKRDGHHSESKIGGGPRKAHSERLLGMRVLDRVRPDRKRWRAG